MGKPKRGSAYLYRDRRRRMRRLRYAKWAAVVLAALLALIVWLIARLVAGAPSPRPEPAPVPTPTVAPTPSPAPTPQATELPDGAVRPPNPNIADEADLIALYRWMIDGGHSTVCLETLGVPQGDIADITDKFSNYFERYRAEFDPPAIRVEFKTGVAALAAIESGDLSRLTDDEREVAQQAQAVIAEVIEPGMSDWEKELALHDYIVNHCDYTLDILAPHNSDALGFFRYGECRCAGYCDAFRLLGRLAGLEVEMIGGPTSRDQSGSKGHAWSLVRLDGLWYVVDISWDDLIEAEPTLEHTFFNVPLACFGETRSCDANYLPEGKLAEALDQNYYFNRPEYIAATESEAVAAAVRQLDASGRAYLMLPDADMARGVSQALARHYGKKGSCFELSEDLDFNLFRFRF